MVIESMYNFNIYCRKEQVQEIDATLNLVGLILIT